MPLPKKNGEKNELNLEDNNQNNTTTTILKIHITTKEGNRNYSSVIKVDKKEADQKYDTERHCMH